MTHAKRRRLWQARLAEYEASELTVNEWCLQNGFRVDQLRYWQRKASKTGFIDGQNQSWACVELVNDGCVDAASVAVMSTDKKQATGEPGVTVRVGAAMIEVRSGFDSALLSEVLRVVVTTC